MDTPSPPPPLDDRYRLLRPLGSGGMGEVWLGEQVSLGRRVAVKLLHPDLMVQPGMMERFEREARLAGRVDHPSVVRVIDFGRAGGRAFLVMELAEGESLHDALAVGPFAPQRALPLLQQLADGLGAIHAQGIVHRDLKPENVVLTRGARGQEQARLLDFGIARLTHPEAGGPAVSQVGVVLGTPEYLSPEQATGAPVDARADLYSFGVLAYRVLTGTLPFKGPGPRQFLAQHVAAPPRPLADACPALAAWPELGALVMRLLEKEPARRPASAQAVADALAALVAQAPAHEPSPAPAATGRYGVLAPAPEAPRGTLAFGTATVAAPAPAPGPGRAAVAPRAQNLVLLRLELDGWAERARHQTHEQNARMQHALDALVLPRVRGSGGRVLSRGAGLVRAAFRSPGDGLRCAMALQDALWRRAQERAAGEAWSARVCLHAGEVLVQRDALVGEPVEVLEAVARTCAPGDVTFTEAVNLARNRAEVAAEPCGELPQAGLSRGALALYRCRRATDGAPYGGLDLQLPAHTGLSLGALVPGALGDRSREALARLGAAARPLATRAAGALSQVAPAVRTHALPGARRGLDALQRHARPAVLVALGLALVTAGGAWVWGTRPAQRAQRLLERHEPAQALKLLEAQPDARTAPRLQRLRAVALHQLARHDDEHALVSALRGEAREGAERLVWASLAEDFADDEGDRGLKRVLAGFDEAERTRALERVARDDAAPKAAWGALRYLEATQHTDGLDLVELYTRALALPDCDVRARAARRLAALGDRDAVPALEKLRASPKEKGLLGDKSCGHDEAAAALKALARKE